MTPPHTHCLVLLGKEGRKEGRKKGREGRKTGRGGEEEREGRRKERGGEREVFLHSTLTTTTIIHVCLISGEFTSDITDEDLSTFC